MNRNADGKFKDKLTAGFMALDNLRYYYAYLV